MLISRKYTLLALVGLVLFCVPVDAQRNLDEIQALMGGQPRQQKASTQNPSAVKVARLHYSGGGDWYWGASALPNFLRYIHENSDFPVDTTEYTVKITDPDLFQYPFLFATGHGTISFSSEEQEQLRQYLNAGGFLFINDSYGMSTSVLKAMRELFPEREVVDLPFDHALYHCF